MKWKYKDQNRNMVKGTKSAFTLIFFISFYMFDTIYRFLLIKVHTFLFIFIFLKPDLSWGLSRSLWNSWRWMRAEVGIFWRGTKGSLARDLFRLCQMAQQIITNNPKLMLELLTRPRRSAKDVIEIKAVW